MKNLHTITDLLSVYATGLSVQAHIRERWERLSALGVGPDGDTAIIFIPDWGQVQAQLDRLSGQSAESLPLYGVPFAIKDNIDVDGWPTTAACPSYHYIAQHTATVVAQLQAAGAILLAKTNLDQFATGLVGTRSPYGAVPNPFDPDYISGGSSSGSAALVSRGLVSFALGTDTAGSGRIPAGFCNLVGTKPTPGLVSTQGVLPACKTLDVVSFFTLTVQDAALVLQAAQTTEATRRQEPQFHAAPAAPRLAMPTRLRIGVPMAPILTSDHYQQAYAAALTKAEALGWQVTPIDMAPLHETATLLYDGPWVAERYSVIRPLLEEKRPDLDPSVSAIVSKGAQFSAQQAFEAEYRLRELAVLAAQIFSNIDLLFLPTAPELPSLKRLREEPIAANSALGAYTNFVNLLGWSAIALPASFTAQGLPFGITLVAPGGHDYALLGVGHDWQRAAQCPVGRHLQDAVVDAPESVNAPSGPPTETIPIAMVGAHLKGMPLHWQVEKAGARLRSRCETAAHYALYALRQSVPPKPGLKRLAQGGAAISVEVYDFPLGAVGTFLSQIPHPLGLGNIELSDGSWVKGFICEPVALDDALEITHFGGWRSFVASGSTI
ncbi:MAG: allophanate hydrolase [Betaproteobacteria bacterium]|nr:allophanate hydrolase [Betaproteobacteria bacterium]